MKIYNKSYIIFLIFALVLAGLGLYFYLFTNENTPKTYGLENTKNVATNPVSTSSIISANEKKENPIIEDNNVKNDLPTFVTVNRNAERNNITTNTEKIPLFATISDQPTDTIDNFFTSIINWLGPFTKNSTVNLIVILIIFAFALYLMDITLYNKRKELENKKDSVDSEKGWQYEEKYDDDNE